MKLTWAVQRSRRPPTRDNIPAGDQITDEVVQDIIDGRALIRGQSIPISGSSMPLIGQIVPVLWQRGRPALVLAHRTRRAQFGHLHVPQLQGIIEELVVGNFDQKGDDVWYRNYGRFEKLGIAGKLRGQPLEARWGYDGTSFVIRCGDGWYSIFTIDRDPTTVADTWEAILLWEGQPLESNATITAATFQKRRSHAYHFFIPHWNWSASWVNHGTEEDPVWQLDYTAYSHEVAAPITGGGSVAIASTQTFGLRDALRRLILDADSQPNISAEIADWYLDSDRHLKFMVKVTWDKFKVAASGSASGNSPYPIGGAPNGLGSVDHEISISGSAVGYIGGGTKQSDLSHVEEVHVFTFDANLNTFIWGTAPTTVTFGTDQRDAFIRAYEHITGSNPVDGPPPGDVTPEDHESYYPGAENNPNATDDTRDEGIVADERTREFSSTDTFQLFSPANLPVLTGPYYTELGGTNSATANLLDGAPTLFPHYFWHFNYLTRTGGIQINYYHRVQEARVFQSNSIPYLFLVLERYPYISGTGYLNDIPAIGVFVLNARTGALVKTLRTWQFGLAGASFVGANAHRIVWTLRAPWINPQATYFVTELQGSKETAFTAAQVIALAQTRTFYLQPDFIWDYNDPKQFYSTDLLPEVQGDAVLQDLAALLDLDVSAPGTMRAANNEEILTPLDRYSAT